MPKRSFEYFASFFELILCTGNMNSYADPFLNKLDADVYAKYLLFPLEVIMWSEIHVNNIFDSTVSSETFSWSTSTMRCKRTGERHCRTRVEGRHVKDYRFGSHPHVGGHLLCSLCDLHPTVGGDPVSLSVIEYSASAKYRLMHYVFSILASLFGHFAV